MSDNQQSTPNSGFDSEPAKQDTPIPNASQGGFDSEPVRADTTVTPAGQTRFMPYDATKFGRYTTPENYEKWAGTQPKIGPDSKPGEYEAWVGAHLTPRDMATNAAATVGEGALAAGTALAIPAIPEILPSVLPHTIEGVKAIGKWADAHPFQAWALYNAIKEFVPGAKKAIGFVKAAPGE